LRLRESDMRLFGVMMVRNEADVIEASVRHNLTVLDGLVVIDHGSFDATADILTKLQGEGLPLRVVRDLSPGFFQAERITTIARETLAEDRADFVFAMDADEFIKVESRERLDRTLAELPGDVHAVAHWLTYVPESFDGGVGRVGPSYLRWRLKSERHGNYKSIIGRSFLKQKEQYVISGNHFVDDLATPKPPRQVRLPQDVVALAHCPVRSREQLERKVIIGYLAHLATQPANDRQAFHWRDIYEELRAGRHLSERRLREIACNYGLPRNDWQPVTAIELIDDPVQLNFELRYEAETREDTLLLLMRFTETLVRPQPD
jgi:Glycosyl transferase family 2